MHSNDPESPITKVNIQAFVKVEIDVNPTRINLRELSPEDKRTESVEVTNVSSAPLEISSITSPHDFISINLSQVNVPISLKSNEKMSFQVLVDASLMKKRNWGQVIIKTDNPHTPTVTLYISGQVKDPNQENGKAAAPTSGSLPSLKFSLQAQRLFSKYNFTLNNVVQSLDQCSSGRCLPMKAYIQLLADQHIPEEGITKAIQHIYGPRAIIQPAQKP